MKLIELGEDARVRLIAYLSAELVTHDSENGRLQERWKNEALDYIAEPSAGADNNYPIQNAASLIIPLQAITVEAYHSRTMGQLFGLDDLVTVQTDAKHQDLRPGLKKFFNHELQDVMKFRSAIESPVLECTKHGTGVISVNYRKTKRRASFMKNGVETEMEITLESGTCIDGIPIADFVMPFYALDTEAAPWVGNRVRFTEAELRAWEANGDFEEGTYDALVGFFAAQTSENDKLVAVREATDTTPSLPSEVELYRLFVDFDLGAAEPGNPNALANELSRIEVYFHKLGNIVCAARFNPDRPYEKGVFFPMEYRWYGLGIAHQVAIFQKEVTTIHRQRLDGNAIANMKMFKVKRTAMGNITDDEPIFPGKKWFVDSMDDIQELNIGSVSPASYNDENQIVVYVQQRTGINELTMGMPNVGTPGTASDSISRVQESTRKFDYTYNNTKEWLNAVVRRAVKSIAKYGPRDVEVYQYIPQGSLVESFLKLDGLDNSLLLSVVLAGAKNNKVLDRNSYTQLSGITQQYWTNILALNAQMTQGQIPPDIAMQAINAANLLFKEVLIAYDIANPEEYIAKIQPPTPQSPGTVLDATGQPTGTAAPSGSPITSILAPNARIAAGTGSPSVNVGQGSFAFAG